MTEQDFPVFVDVTDEAGNPIALPFYWSDVKGKMSGIAIFALLASRGVSDGDLDCLFDHLRGMFDSNGYVPLTLH